MSQYIQANNRTHQRTAPNPSRFSSLLLPVILTISCADSFADIEDFAYLRQEPITPIPTVVDADLEKAAIGELLFYDTRLSRNKALACATCHRLESGGDDDASLGRSHSADTHTVNTPTVFNAVFNFRQHWDGAIETSEQLVEHTIVNQHEFNNSWDRVIKTLSADETLRQMFEDEYDDGMTRETIVDAIVEFQKTLVTPNARFDRFLRNETDALSEDEIKGYRVFKESGCVSCHQGVNIGGNLFQKFGVFYDYLAERGDMRTADFGRMNVTNRYIDEFVFKVPSLRNIEVTAPYLHDGSAETLEEVIAIMGKTQLGRELDDEEIQMIKSFLLTLTGEYKGVQLGGDS